jgi:hypothetical protein
MNNLTIIVIVLIILVALGAIGTGIYFAITSTTKTTDTINKPSSEEQSPPPFAIGDIVVYNVNTGTSQYPALCAPGDNSVILYKGKIMSINVQNKTARVLWNEMSTVGKSADSCSWNRTGHPADWQSQFVGNDENNPPSYITGFPIDIPWNLLTHSS